MIVISNWQSQAEWALVASYDCLAMSNCRIGIDKWIWHSFTSELIFDNVARHMGQEKGGKGWHRGLQESLPY